MLRVAVFSDTHGFVDGMTAAVERECPDVVLHLGDHDRDAAILRRLFPTLPVFTVCGNCDGASSAPLSRVVELGPVKAFLTHGHAHGVRRGIDTLVYAAQEAGTQLALFGHTHIPMNTVLGGVQVLNPGTAGFGFDLTWALVSVYDNGGIACEIRPITTDKA